MTSFSCLTVLNSDLSTQIDKQNYNSNQGLIETLFSKLMGLDLAARKVALLHLKIKQPTLHTELKSLLASAEQAKGFLSVSPIAAIPELESNTATRDKQNIGPYLIIRELGRGGMGTVYLAERADGVYQKQVAIKLVNQFVNSEMILHRFKAERQILANLDHPNIAGLLDGGTTDDGCPYLVMEYIQGEPIDTYCQNKQLTIKEKIKLFIKVCAAVQYAHQNLIVHRDLKPANILITKKGIPKLLDFGIAKLLEDKANPWQNRPQTQIGLPMMTPEYASPEQMLGEAITTATDVYGLGVILYEILTGHRPYNITQGNFICMAKIVCEHKVMMPSNRNPALRSQLQGDLDNIMLLALRKEPELRYQSVQNMASDLQHHLKGTPVRATRNSLSYRLTKFVKRNKLGVSLGGLALFLLFAGIIISTWQWQLSKAEQKRAELHYQEIRSLANSIVFEVTEAVAKLPESTRLRKSLLKNGLVYLDSLAQDRSDDPELQNELAKAYYKLAMVQGSPIDNNLGNINEARVSFNKAMLIWEKIVADNPANSSALIGLGLSYKRQSAIFGSLGELQQALSYANRCITLLDWHIQKNQLKVKAGLMGCYAVSAHWLTALGDYVQAKQRLVAAMQLIDNNLIDQPAELPLKTRMYLARIYEELAEIDTKQGHLDNAVSHERRRLTALQSLPGDHQRSRRLADAYHGLAERQAKAGAINNAFKTYQTSLTFWSKRANKYPDDVRPRQGMAGIYADLSKWHTVLADQEIDSRNSVIHKKIACEYSQRSQTILEKLPNQISGFGMRYSWLQTSKKKMLSLANQCEVASS